MLTFETPYYEIDGIIVFRDHSSPTTFHYLAGAPRLSMDEAGQPQFSLLTYRHAIEAIADTQPTLRDELGGGFLTLGVDCRIPDDKLSRVRSRLQGMQGPGAAPVNLVPVLYTAGKVEVLALDHQAAASSGDAPPAADTPTSRFVRGVLGTAVPSLLQDQRAIFSIALSPDGVTLLEQAYTNDLAPIGVMYQLEFAGLRPALDVKVKADLSRCYESFKAGLDLGVGGGSGGGKMIDVDISAAIEKLVQDGAIEVHILRQQEGASVDQMEQRALTLLKETLLQKMFEPAMSSQAPATDPAAALQNAVAMSRDLSQTSSGSSGSFQLTFSLKYVHRDELVTVTYDYSVIAPERRTHAPNGFISALLSDTDRARCIRQVNLDSEFFETLSVRTLTTADFVGLDLQAIQVAFQYGGTEANPEVTGDVIFRPDDTAEKFFQAARDGRPASWRHSIRYTFGDAEHIAAAAHVYDTPWRTSTSRALVVHPPEDVAMLRVIVEPGVVAWDLVEEVEVHVSHVDEAHDFSAENVFSVKQDSERRTWIVRLADPTRRDYTVRYTWHLANGNEIAGQAFVERAAQLFVPDPFQDRLRVVVEPQLDPARFARATVVVRYSDRDEALDVTRTVELLGPEFHPAQVDIPIVHPERRTYTFEYSILPLDGSPAVVVPPTGSDRSVLYVADGTIRINVDVSILGDLQAEGLLGVQVDLRGTASPGHTAEVASHLFEPGGDRHWSSPVVLPVAPPHTWTYRVLAFRQDGRVSEGEWEKTDVPRLTMLAKRISEDLE